MNSWRDGHRRFLAGVVHASALLLLLVILTPASASAATAPDCKALFALATDAAAGRARFETPLVPGAGRTEVRIDEGMAGAHFRLCGVTDLATGTGLWEPVVRGVANEPDEAHHRFLTIDTTAIDNEDGTAPRPPWYWPVTAQTFVVVGTDEAGVPVSFAWADGLVGRPHLGWWAATIAAVLGAVGLAIGHAFFKLLEGPAGALSLTNLQVSWFSWIVFVLVVYGVARDGTLADLSEDVLWLMGIAAGSGVGARLADFQKARLSLENWQWVENQDWLRVDAAAKPPRRCLLCTAEGTLDIFRVQALGFSILVGVGMLLQGVSSLATFTLPAGVLAVLGLSQVTYIGGKFATPPSVKELDEMITAFRDKSSPTAEERRALRHTYDVVRFGRDFADRRRRDKPLT